MNLFLKSDRRFIARIIYIPLIIVSICILILLLGLFISPEDTIVPFAFCVTIFFIFVVALLLVRFIPKPKYEFSKDYIVIVKNKNIMKIQLDEIVSMEYYTFKAKYILLPITLISIPGCWKICIIDKNNNSYNLGFFSCKTAKEIEKLYPNILKIK